MKTFKLHLIRHGLTAGNLQGLYIGSGTDIPLCILVVKFHIILTQKLCQLILKALCCLIQRTMLHLLNNADVIYLIPCAVICRIIAAAA